MEAENFENALKLYDPALELRWGHITQCWVVERKCFVPPELMATLVDGMRKALALMHHPELSPDKRYLLQKACEEGYSAGYGKRVIIYTKKLDNRVFDTLKLGDLQRGGNLQKAIDRSVNREDQKKRDRHNEYEPLGREVVSVVDWAARKHSTEVEHGKAPKLMAEAFKRDIPVHTRQHFDLVDAQGVSMAPKKKVKIELARA